MIKLKKLSKSFETGTINEVNLFNDFSLEIKKGQFVTIIGSNGAGKSTLLNLISGTLEIDDGSIIIDDVDVTNKKEHQRSKFIGRVFQNPSLGVAPNMTILENLSLADAKGQKFGLQFGINKKRFDYYKDILTKLDLGLEDKLNIKVKMLSGGQRQALTLLMSVMSKPKLLLLDEHTAALDPKTSAKIMNITREIVKDENMVTIMVTHNMQHAIDMGDRLLMMHRGEVIIDKEGSDKQGLTVENLIETFESMNIAGDLSDRVLLS